MVDQYSWRDKHFNKLSNIVVFKLYILQSVGS